MKQFILLPARLDLFEGQSGTAEASGENQAIPAGAQQGTSGDTPAEPLPPEEAQDAPAASEPGEDRRKAFLELVKTEYSDVYAGEIQRIINQRFKAGKLLEQRLAQQQPLMDALEKRYGALAPDALLEALEWDQSSEDEAERKKLQEEKDHLEDRVTRLSVARRMEDWLRQEEQTRRKYPEFSLERAAEDPEFLHLLRAGVSVECAYEVQHVERLRQRLEGELKTQRRARDARPSENGAAARNAFTMKEDVSRLSRLQRAELARRAARGETIRF